jgi:signal transduction histidine kinase
VPDHEVFTVANPDSVANADAITRADMNQHVEKILSGEFAAGGASECLPDLRRAFEASPVATLIAAEEGSLLCGNAAAGAVFRAAAPALAGLGVAQLLPGITRGGRVAADTLRASPFRHMSCRRTDGQEFHASVRIATLAPAIYIVTVDELGEGEVAAPELRARVTTLESELAARSAELDAANKEFESFTSAAGHDLRGPLRVLNGFTEALADECGELLNEEGKTFLAEILKASERMEGLIDGLLALSRAGRAEFHPERLDISTLVDLVYYEFRNDDTARQVDSTVEPGLMVWGDVRLIMTVLRNLIGNAWKFTARTSAPVVRVHGEVRDGQTWICVTDNGAGFDPAYGERLYKPFARLHRQDEFPGHGLGLATVKRIVARHQGGVAAECVPGVGTTFRFWLGPEPA